MRIADTNFQICEDSFVTFNTFELKRTFERPKNKLYQLLAFNKFSLHAKKYQKN